VRKTKYTGFNSNSNKAAETIALVILRCKVAIHQTREKGYTQIVSCGWVDEYGILKKEGGVGGTPEYQAI